MYLRVKYFFRPSTLCECMCFTTIKWLLYPLFLQLSILWLYLPVKWLLPSQRNEAEKWFTPTSSTWCSLPLSLVNLLNSTWEHENSTWLAVHATFMEREWTGNSHSLISLLKKGITGWVHDLTSTAKVHTQFSFNSFGIPQKILIWCLSKLTEYWHSCLSCWMITQT